MNPSSDIMKLKRNNNVDVIIKATPIQQSIIKQIERSVAYILMLIVDCVSWWKTSESVDSSFIIITDYQKSISNLT